MIIDSYQKPKVIIILQSKLFLFTIVYRMLDIVFDYSYQQKFIYDFKKKYTILQQFDT